MDTVLCTPSITSAQGRNDHLRQVLILLDSQSDVSESYLQIIRPSISQIAILNPLHKNTVH
jgi:hypothetical protein